MKEKLFEIVGGNQFKLITENVNGMTKESLVKEGLRKVFMNAGNKISYKHLQGVGMGYIKSVSDAQKCAIQEARILAKEYGYVDNESAQAFVKEQNWAGLGDDEERWESPPANTPGHGAEESHETQIGLGIKHSVKTLRDLLIKKGYSKALNDPEIIQTLEQISDFATELVSSHTPGGQ